MEQIQRRISDTRPSNAESTSLFAAPSTIDDISSMFRQFLATTLVCIIPAVMPAVAFAGDLSFILSAKTDKHIALQPQSDHHRVHFLVRARQLAHGGCIAQLVCETEDKRRTSSEVEFYPKTDDESFAIYFRTPKALKQSATYTLTIREIIDEDVLYNPKGMLAPEEVQDAVEFSEPGRISFVWTIDRDDSGKAVIKYPNPGESWEVSISVSKAVPENQEVNGREITRWKMVWEQRTMTVAVPRGFRFGVDNENNREDAFIFVRSLK